MAKERQQKLVSAPKKKKNKKGAPVVDLLEKDGWTVVKKQKVTILIPPLAVTEQSSFKYVGESQLPLKLRKTVDNHSEYPAKTCSLECSVFEIEKSTSPAPEISVPTTKIVDPHPSPVSPKPSNPSYFMESEYTNANSPRALKSSDVYRPFRVRKHTLIFADGRPLLNQRMRIVNIEKKLKRAGGLSNWLVSLGLERFIKIFQQKNVNKFHLANLTMKKLKDMGAVAVGPRRKLMHAIDCICQPYCFEHF